MREPSPAGPESSAVRVALWRAIHLQHDSSPYVLEDEVGLRLVDPPADWRDRPDMHPQGTSLFRASILARARFIEDLACEQASRGIDQYVILGAGLDTFAQRQPDVAANLDIYEVDQPGPQAWKRRRLEELGLGASSSLRFVPVDFEAGDAWLQKLSAAGFDAARPAIVASTGVSMYLTKETVADTLRRIASFASGSTFVMSFLVPLEMMSPEVQPGCQRAEKGARAAGTPFLSYFTPEEMLNLAREAGFSKAEHVSSGQLGERYFAGRPDGLAPPKCAEELLLATV